MHPRERVLGIAYLCHEKGQEIPKHVLKEAEQLGIDVSEYQIITTTNHKETANGRKKTNIRDT
jgi:hypothetical protein